MFIIWVMNFDWWDVPENIHSQASLSSGEPIKCRVSLFSRGQKTIRPIISLVSYFFTCESYHGDYHSCPILVAFQSFAKLYKFALQMVFKDEFLWKNEGEEISRVCNFGRGGVYWKHGEQKHERKKLSEMCNWEYTMNEAKGIWRKWLPREYRQTL